MEEPFPFSLFHHDHKLSRIKLTWIYFLIIEDMGAYKYLEEIWRKKQSDALRFLLRVR